MITLGKVNMEDKKTPDKVNPGSAEPLVQDSQVSGQQEQITPQGQGGATSVFQPSEGQEIEVPIPKVSILHRIPKIFIVLLVILGLLAILAFVVLQFTGNGGIELFGKRGKLTWWGLTDNRLTIQPLIEEYQKENPKVEITYVAQSTKDYRERLTNALARGDGPDIFQFHNSWVPMFANELDSLPSSVMSQTEFADTYYPVISSDLTTKEGIVGIPLGFDAITLYINEDIFAAAGRTHPTKWDEVRQLAKELTSTDMRAIKQSGLALGITDNVDHWQEVLALMMMQEGVSLVTPSGAKAEGVFKFFKVFATEDRVWDGTLPTSTIAFAQGKLAMYFGPSWRVEEINQINPNLRYKTVPLPQLRKEDPAAPDISYATYWVEGVWKRSTNKALAWDFLKFLSTKDSLEKLYQNREKTRVIGRPYPRVDMTEKLIEHPIIGSIVLLAPNARSWYLADATNDGVTGINSKIGQYYQDALESSLGIKKTLEALATGITQTLTLFGIGVR